MKKNLKFFVAVFGITIATFGSMDVNAAIAPSNVNCIKSPKHCGWTPLCEEILGDPKSA
jgi:hypothetical protein